MTLLPLPILIVGIVFAVALCVAGKCAFNGVCRRIDERGGWYS